MFRIISTLGPSSLKEAFLKASEEVRQFQFRLNGSHLTPEMLRANVDFVRNQLPRRELRFYLDLQGSKVRIGDLPEPMKLSSHATVILSTEELPGRIPFPHASLLSQIQAGQELLLQDSEIRLLVLETSSLQITARVIQGGTLRSRSGVYFAGMSLFQKGIPEIQMRQIQIAAEFNLPYLALSYVQNAQELNLLRDVCRQMNYFPEIVAKIERSEALEHLKEIIQASDEVWFCRGDLGNFIPWKFLGTWQEEVIKTARQLHKPVYIAGQVFQHMVHSPQPTRSEVVHLHCLLQQGASGIVLSDETAIGEYPVQTLFVLHQLLEKK